MANPLKCVLFFVLLFLAGCGSGVDLEYIADDDIEKRATALINQLIAGESEKIVEILDPRIVQGDPSEVFAQMSQLFPDRDPEVVNLIGYNVMKYGDEPTSYNLTYQYDYGDAWLATNVAFRTLSSGVDQILGMNVYPLKQSLQEIHRFRLGGKGALHYAVLGICILNPAFILVSLVVCARTKDLTRKWLWILIILVGVVKFSLNWTSGAYTYNILSIQLLGTGATTVSQYAPWLLHVSIPAGAIIFWIQRRSITEGKEKKYL